MLLPVTVQTQGLEIVRGAGLCEVGKAFYGDEMVYFVADGILEARRLTDGKSVWRTFLRGRFQTTEQIDPNAEVMRFVEESLDASRLGG